MQITKEIHKTYKDVKIHIIINYKTGNRKMIKNTLRLILNYLKNMFSDGG